MRTYSKELDTHPGGAALGEKCAIAGIASEGWHGLLSGVKYQERFPYDKEL